MQKNEIKPGKYRHFKGHEYEFIAIAKDSTTLEDVVIYKALYDSEFGKKVVWVRPLKSFLETVTKDGKEIPRFEYISK